MSLKTSILFAGTGLALIASAGAANAAAYAYGDINFTGLSLTGLTATGVSVDSANVSTRDSSGFPGAAAQSNAGVATSPTNPLTAGSDVLQAFSGAGPAPAENTYTQALLNSLGATRGDAQLTGNLITGVGTGANDVAEGRIVTPGSASSTAGTTTGFNVTVTLSQATTFTLAFNASDNVTATTTNPGELSSASASASFTVSGNGVNDIFAPSALNISTTATGIGGNNVISNASSAYTHSVSLAAGTYQLSLLSGAQEQVLAASPAAVPEPMTLTLLGSGLLAVGALRRRRRD